MVDIVFPRDGQGFRAEVVVGDTIHWVLMATHSASGPSASLYDAKIKKWRYREWAEDFDFAKSKAENHARKFYNAVGLKEPFPGVEWKETG